MQWSILCCVRADFEIEAIETQVKTLWFTIEDLKAQSFKLVVDDRDNFEMASRAWMNPVNLQVLNANKFQRDPSGAVLFQKLNVYGLAGFAYFWRDLFNTKCKDSQTPQLHTAIVVAS